ncbi:MAG: Eco57I restriction-modification methylase domain-containing protein [Treponema sp.]|nr:Eco57I restriction-modification methylase domain-containing protein [Treponema sp.]
MKLEVIKSAQGYDNYRIIGEMTEELKNFFVEKGYRWSSYNKCYYPGTLEAKYENTSFTEELEKTFFSNNNNDINNKNKEKTVLLEDLIAELREEIRLQKEKIKELESVIEEKNNNVDGIIPKYKSEITNVDTELEEQIDNAIDNKDYEHLANLTTIPENEVQADILWDIEDETEIIITEEELEICKKIIPPNQYAYTLGLTQGEEGDFYKQKLKDIAKIAKQITTDDELVNNDGTHNVGFHYFVGNSDFYISEIKSDGLAFGYTILNGDIEMAEWGYQDLDEIINASQWIEMDYHVPEGMTIERMLEEKYPEYYKQESVVEIEVEKTQDLNLKENIFHSGFNALHVLNEKYAIEFIPAEEGKIEVNSEADKWIVKFYDISKVIPGDLIDKGRFIQSYYASSLLQHQDSNVGLNLGYGWKLDAETFMHAKELIKDFVSIDMSEIFSSKQNNTQQEKTKIENDKEYARELADWIIQYGLENSVSQENYIISYDDIIENTDTTIEWLNKNYELVNEALAEHSDNELLEYDPEESNKNDFNLYFCSNATEKGENTLFKQNKNGRWVRKTDEELELELQEESELENEPVYTINGIEYLESEIEAGLREDIRQIFQEYDASEIEENLVLNNVKLYKGENIDQLSLLVEYDSKNPNNKWTEDALFNALAEESISFAGMKVDINPITPEKSGTIEEYLNKLDSIKTDFENVANKVFETVTKQYGNNYKEFYDTYEILKEQFIENENRYVGDARVRESFKQAHNELVKLQVEELDEIIKQSQNLEIAKIASIRYFNAFGNDGLTTDNLYLSTGIGSYSNGRFSTSQEKMQEYIENRYSTLHEKNIHKEPHTKKEIKNIREQCREILQKSDNEITEEDKLILAQYEGGGGINEENRTSAQVLNEFYTPNNLIEKVWSLVDAYHPNGKTVLEPTAGIGKFANNRPNNQFTMHELDETSARINKILHPEAKLIQGAYQKQFLDENERAKNPDFIQPKYDIVIGNPPYGEYSGKYKNIEGKHHQRYEEYFIEKGLDALKDENSILAYVVPSGFLDSKNDKVKELIASKGQFVDAYRLPAGTFSTTDVGTDILIMRSWEKVRKEFDKDFTNDGHLITKEQAFKSFQRGNAELLSNGEHFKDHPEKILGEIKQRTNQFGKLVDAVVHHEGLSIQDELNKIDDFVSEIKKSNTYENQQESNIESIEELEVVEKESENQKQNYIFEKLSAAGIEVVTDKNEFNRILEREELLQKMAIDFSEFEKLEESINNQKSSNLHLQDEKLDLESQKKILQQKNHAKFVEVVKQLEKYIPTNEYMNTTKSVSFYSKVLINSTKLSDRASNNIFLIKVNNPGQNDIFVVRQDPKLYWVEILGKFNDFEKLSQFESVQTLFNDTVIIENFTENLKSYMQQQLVIEQQKQNKLINEVNSSMQKLKEMDIKNSDILSDFVQLDKSLRFNSNFEIESSSLNDMVSIFPGSTGKSGLGIRHIIEERYKKDNLSQDEITALIGLVLDAVRSGKITRESEFQSEFTKNGIVGIVRKNFFGEEKNWILTGFGYDEKSDIDKNREATEAIQTVIAQYSQSQDYSYFRNQVGAVISSLDLNISQTENKSTTQNFITKDGTIYGFTHEGKIYLNPDIVSLEAAIHEYTHLWDNYIKVTNPELWNKGKDIFKNTYLWEEVKNDPNYQDIANDEDLILSECHARITGKIADQILDKILTENGELTKNTVIDWDKEVFEYISKEFSEIDIKSLSEFVSQTMKDFMEGKKLDLSKNLQQEETPKITKEVIERKIMNVEDFSKLYGKKYDENEIPIWKATNWEGIINLSELNSEEIKYLNSSDNYIQADFGKWTHKILFMSGDIYSKIANYQEKIANKQYKLTSNEIDPGTELLLKQEIELYSKNINLLNSIKKDLVPIENIHLSLKSTMAEEFFIEHFDEEGNIIKLNLQESFILWAKNESYADMKDRKSIDFSTSKISREDLNEKVSWSDIISYIDSESVKAERTSSYFRDSDEVKQLKSQRKKEADEKRQARSDIANKLFDKYIHEGLSEQIKKNLEYEYNQKFNSYVAPDYSKLPLFIDGMSSHKGSSSFKLYEQQIKGISFLCNKGNGLLAYDVGVGKTASGIVATVNQIQSGRSKRPLILVPNQVYSKWYTDIKELFPNVQINDLFNLNEKSVAAFRDSENKNKLNIPENSISLITYEALSRMTFTDDSIKNALFEDFKNLLSIDFDGSEKENASAVEKIKEVIGYSSNVKDSNYFFFEDCGFDNITVDEAHNFKNLWTVPRPKTKGESNEYSGIPSGKPSARALKLYATTQLIQRNNDNRNVFLLTATPFTNSPLEVYSMLTYIGRERLHQAGLNSLRDFLNQFAQTKYELGVNSKGEIDTKQVMKNWRQLPALQSILTEYIDKVDGEEAGIIRPKKFTHVKPLDMTPLQKRMRECDEIRMSSMESSADTIVAMNNMRIAAVAPALANQFMYPDIQLPSINELVETSPKLSFVCNSIIDMYKNNSEKGQFLFLPLGKESHGIIKDYLVKHGIPKEAIEIINGDINNTPEKKEKITSKFNDPKEKLKIIIGGKNTSEGIDLNGNSFVMYNCSLGWNPSETIQAEGRIWRQGNKQGHVHIVYPLMNDSIDSVLYQKHDEKRSRINELWTYKGDSLNVEDINPEELKLELIKDPKKRAKLILDEETKDLKADLSRIDLKIKNYDEIIENKISLGKEKERYEESVAEYSKYIEDCKNRNEEVPIWYKSCLDRNKRQLKSANLKLDKINSKLEQLNIFDEESSVTYIRELNEQKKILVDKIESVKEKIPDIIQKLQIELAEQKLLEYPIDKQRKILETDILSNLRPMKEVEVEIKTERYEKMMNLKFHNKEISEEEYKVFVRAGYKLYEEYTKGEIDFKYLQTEVSGELPTIKDLPNNNTISFTWNQGELFFDEEPIINDSSSIAYTNSQNRIDDVHITPEQITESEIKRDEIILPILNGQKSGMYKAFNDFAEHGVFDIIGSQIELENNVISKNGWAQLHAAMNIYRDKKFETFRYIFIEKATGEIKDQVAVAAYMPHRSLISPYKNTLKEIISRAEQQDYLVAVAHNHPSGNIKPSDEDVYSTDKLMKSFTANNGNSRFIGHIILDHNSFSYYDPQTGWQEGSKFEHTQDNLINKNYLLNDLYVDNTLQLHTIATKINDLNNWNDDFIPVIFTNSQNMVSGLKLYHKDYFNQSSEKIRNEFQFDGLNVGSIRAFPIITESFAKNNDMEQFEKKLMNHIKNNAFQDASIPKVISITDKFNIPVGKDYFDKINHDEIKINSTWDRFVTPELFSNKQDIKKTETIEW